MNCLTWVHFISSIAYLFLAAFILLRNPRVNINRVCALLFVLLSIWSTGYIFIHNNGVTQEIAWLAKCISSFGWCSLSSMMLLFALILAGNVRALRSPLFYILVFGPAVFFIYQQFSGRLVSGFIKTSYGWAPVWDYSIWPYAFFFFHGVNMVAGCWILFDFSRRTQDSYKRKQALLISFSAFMSFVLGALTDGILPLMGIHSFPAIADIVVALWASAIVYAIAKLKMMGITPATAAKNIISTINECLILVNKRGKIVTVNLAACRLLGYNFEEIEGKSLSVVFPRDTFESNFFSSILNGIEYKDYDHVLVTKNNEVIPVILSTSVLREESGTVAGIVCLATDIRERKRNEEILRQAHADLEKRVSERTQELKKLSERLAEESQRLEVTLSSIADAVISVDINCAVLLMNQAAEKITGWQQKEALSQPLSKVFNVISEDTRLAIDDSVAKAIVAGKVMNLPDVALLVNKDGKEAMISYSVAPIRDRAGGIIGGVLVFRDITERRRMEHELLKTIKLESLGLLAGGIAHDFNNILTGLIANITLAKLQVDSRSEVHKILTDAEYASMRAKDLTHQLLTFAKGGAPVKRVSLMSDILRDTAEFVLSGSNCRADLHIADDLWPVEVDSGQISQVIHNLMLNAAQAMPNGGTIRVVGENFSTGDEAGNPLVKGRYVKIAVEDSGEGIAPRHLQNIFDPYFTTKPKGSGLGLATSYSIIRKHQGFIFVKSEIGKGSVFSIYLPASDKPPSASKTEDVISLTEIGARVLVMDDESIILQTVRRVLSAVGCKVECVTNGEDAVRVYKDARDAGHPFDVVILDLVIPAGVGGKDTLDHLKVIEPGVKAIVSSGYSHDKAMSEYEKYGFKGVVPKPYNSEELINVVQRVLNE